MTPAEIQDLLLHTERGTLERHPHTLTPAQVQALLALRAAAVDYHQLHQLHLAVADHAAGVHRLTPEELALLQTHLWALLEQRVSSRDTARETAQAALEETSLGLRSIRAYAAQAAMEGERGRADGPDHRAAGEPERPPAAEPEYWAGDPGDAELVEELVKLGDLQRHRAELADIATGLLDHSASAVRLAEHALDDLHLDLEVTSPLGLALVNRLARALAGWARECLVPAARGEG